PSQTPTSIYTLSLHDALPISLLPGHDEVPSTLVADRNVHFVDLDLAHRLVHRPGEIRIDLDLEVIHRLQGLVVFLAEHHLALRRDRKSTRLNSSHQIISYAVF